MTAVDSAAVLALVEQFGVPVFPCKQNDKKPLTDHGFKNATRDPVQIAQWAKQYPRCNWGMPTGAVSGFNVLDVDIKPDEGKHGDEALRTLEAEHGALPATPVVLTPSGGFHYWFRTNGAKLPSTSCVIGNGLDTRGEGGYIILPPSVIDDKPYEWEAASDPGEIGFAETPAWLVALFAAKTETPEDTSDRGTGPVALLENIVAGRALHDSLRNLAAHYAGIGLAFAEIVKLLETAMHASKTPRDDRWHERYKAIPGLVHTAIEKFRTAPAAPEIIVKRSPLEWATLAERNPPLREWAVFGWLGFFINLLVGSGGIGKTLLAQIVGSALALGRDYIDAVAKPLVVLMWGCEDEHDELWRRQVQIAQMFGVNIAEFRDKFIIIPRLGLENVLVTTEFGRPMFTPLIGELSEQADDYHADVVILDNVAQLYGGNESDRHAVTFFVNGLAGALPGRAVLLLAHPARSLGSEFSGSSAWENCARNRLFLGSHLPDQQPDADEQPDENIRYLARRKANYSAKDWRRFQYQNGVLVPDVVEQPGGLVGHLQEQAAERVILEGLTRLEGMKIRATEGTRSPLFLPRLLVEYKLHDGHGRAELGKAMRRLMVTGVLARAEVGRYPNRTPMFGLKTVHK